MADGQRSALGVPAQSLVGLELNLGQENAPTLSLATVVATAGVEEHKLWHVTHRNVQVSFESSLN